MRETKTDTHTKSQKILVDVSIDSVDVDNSAEYFVLTQCKRQKMETGKAMKMKRRNRSSGGAVKRLHYRISMEYSVKKH